MSSPTRRAATLRDVAREAGVAVSTASRALTVPGRVSPATEQHVQAVARRLHYRPNQLAQALPSGHSKMLGLLVADITNPHNFDLIRGAEAHARASGYTLILGDTQEKAALEKDYAERLESAVDGFILAGSRLPSRDLQEILDRRPVVLFNRVARNFPSVVTDFVDGSRQIVEHLAALGHRRIGYLGGPRNAWSDAQRWRSLSSFATAADIEVVRVGPYFPSVEHGAQAADAGLATGATALVFFNDLLAIGGLQRLEARGVTVPQDVSIVGNDDIFGSDFCNPPLTTVATESERAGRELIDLLLGPPPSSPSARIVLPTALQVRASTGPPTDVRSAQGRGE